jgi:hypothetical protein
MKKTIEIDWDNPTDIKKKILLLKKRRKTVLERLGARPLTFAFSQFNVEHVMPALEEMINFTPYQDILTEFSNGYYLYFHCDPRKRLNIKTNLKHLLLSTMFNMKYEPFYVGKGIGNRAYDLCRNDSHRKRRTNIRNHNEEIVVHIAKKGMGENQALYLEGVMMDILGLISHSSKTGMLVNLDEGSKKERFEFYNQLKYKETIYRLLSLNKVHLS